MLGDRIKELRLAQNLTQVQLADKLGVSKQTVSNWENGNIPPSIDMLLSVIEYFHCSADYLLGLDGLRTIRVDGLTIEQASHLQALVQDLKKNNQ